MAGTKQKQTQGKERESKADLARLNASELILPQNLTIKKKKKKKRNTEENQI